MNRKLCKHCDDYMETIDQAVCLWHEQDIDHIIECRQNQIIQNLMIEEE